MHGHDPGRLEEVDHSVEIVQLNGELFSDDCHEYVAVSDPRFQLLIVKAESQVAQVGKPQPTSLKSIERIIVRPVRMIRIFRRRDSEHALAVNGWLNRAPGNVQRIDNLRTAFDKFKR